MEANAAMRNIVRKDTGEGYNAMLDNHTGEVGAGLKYCIGDFSVSANYDFQFSEHRASHGVNAVLRLEF